ARYLVFQTGAVALLENRRGDKHKQVPFSPSVKMLLEKVSEHWDVPHDRHFIAALGYFILKQSADRKSVAALDQNIRIQRSCVDDRTRHSCASKNKGCIRHLV